LAALRVGDVSEWRATLVARETACLDPADRRVADAELGPVLAGLGDREVQAAARAVAYRLDPRAFVDRTQGAASDRSVTLRPAPDTMSRLAAFLPVAQGVAAHTALSTEADRLTAAGDQRSRGQIMADTLVERVTGQATAGAVPVEVALVMPAETLLGVGTSPASWPAPAGPRRGRPGPGHRPGHESVAAPGLHPTRGRVAGRDGLDAAPVPTGLRRLIRTRDRTCRTPWCGAPIRHTDHVIPVADGGKTSAANGQGCARPATTPNKPPAGPPHPHPDRAGPATGSRSPPPPDTATPATHHPCQVPHHPATTEASSRNTSAASSTPPENRACRFQVAWASGSGELLDDRAELVQVTDEERRDAEAIAQLGELLDEPVVRPDEDVR
jgi:hypothetical protein